MLVLAFQRPVFAWDEDGHAIVTHLAIDALPADMPEWIRTPEIRERLVYLSSEPDRWRGQNNYQLDHINGPDHYMDEEKLHPYGLSLKNLPLFRVQFTDIMARQRTVDPNAKPDRDYTRDLPGFLPYRIAELQWQISAGWTQLRTYEAFPDKVTPGMIRNARENIIYSMGLLSHFVGDGSQPLHITKHHHGWVGDNPKGYTTDKRFHAFIDGGVIDLQGINYDDLKPRALPPRRITKSKSWRDVCNYLYETFEQVEPLYALEKSGELKKEKGKAFIEHRLLEGGSALAGVWSTAYRCSHLDEFRVNRLKTRPVREPGRKAEPVAGKEAAN